MTISLSFCHFSHLAHFCHFSPLLGMLEDYSFGERSLRRRGRERVLTRKKWTRKSTWFRVCRAEMWRVSEGSDLSKDSWRLFFFFLGTVHSSSWSSPPPPVLPLYGITPYTELHSMVYPCCCPAGCRFWPAYTQNFPQSIRVILLLWWVMEKSCCSQV